MQKAIAVLFLTLSAVCFLVLVGGLVDVIYRLGFRSACLITIQSWPPLLLLAGLTIGGPVFLVAGLSLLKPGDPPA
jgi:hypothetical protein